MPDGVTVNISYELLNTHSQKIKNISIDRVQNVKACILSEVSDMSRYWDGTAANSFQVSAYNGMERLCNDVMEFGELFSDAMDSVVEQMKAQEEATQARNSSDLSGT